MCVAAIMAAAVLASGGNPAVVKSEFIYTEAPFPQCHASTLVQADNGTLVTAWFGGTREKNPDVGIWVSRKLEGGWTAPVEVANGVQYVDGGGKVHRHPCWNPVLFQPSKGPLMLFYKCGADPRTWWGLLSTSSDHGETWSWPHRLPEGIWGPVKNKPVELADGSVLCGTSGEATGWCVYLQATRDLGRTWRSMGPVNDGEKIGAIQPSILTHADGRLQILCRSKQSRIVEAWSKDQGKTWSEATLTDLPNPNAGTDAVTLKDGRQLLVYNHTIRGNASPRNREMLNVAISKDGVAWVAAMVLENKPKSEFSYPAVIQTRDGLVHITYTWLRRRVKHVVLDPGKLTGTPIVDGKWPAGK